MDNIILIGMPGAGKSTIGVLLAKTINYRFIDTDLIIQRKYGKLLIWPVASSIKEGINSTFSIIRLSLYNCLFLLYAFSLN